MKNKATLIFVMPILAIVLLSCANAITISGGTPLNIRDSSWPSYLNTSLTTYVPMNENTGSLAVDAFKLHNLSTSATWTTGIIDSALLMAVGKETNLTDSTSLNLNSINMSMSFWIYPISATNGYLLDKGCYGATPSGESYCIQYDASTGRISWGYNLGGASPVGMDTITGISNLNSWHHIVITRNTNTQNNTLYVDGVVVNSTLLAPPTVTNTQPVTLGYRLLSLSGEFVGKMDEFGLWSRTLNISDVQTLYSGKPGIYNSLTHNTTAYETESQSFIANITYNSSQFALNSRLIYDGTAYSATTSGSGDNVLVTKTMDIPSAGSKAFYWNTLLTNSTGTYSYNTTTQTQAVTAINLTICGAAPQNTPFVNFTFKDENTLANINAILNLGSFSYYLGSGTVNKTYTFSNSSGNPSYAFCFTPIDRTLYSDTAFRYSGSGYPQREYNVLQTLTNTTTNKLLYLLSSADGIYSTFIVDNQAFAPISGATVQIYRDFSGVSTLIGQSTTGSDGAATFWLNPVYTHTIIVSKSGYATSTLSVKPTQSTYSIILAAGSSNASFSQYLPGAKWSYSPAQQVLIANTVYTFGLNMNYSAGGLVSCRLSLTNSSGYELATASGCTSYGGTVSLAYNVGNNSIILLHTYINVGNGEVVLDPVQYWISGTNSSSWGTLKSFFASLSNVNSEFGADSLRQSFSKIVGFFFLLTILLAFLNLTTGIEFSSPTIIILFMYGAVLFGSIGGFFTMPYTPDSTTTANWIWNSWVRQYFIAGLSSFFIGAFFINKWRRETT